MRVKPEQIIFYLLIFTVPVQSRLILHRWTEPFNQWTSSYLYGTDILLGLLFIFWLVRILKIDGFRIFNFPGKVSRKTLIFNPNFWLVLFFVISLFSIFSSRVVGLSFYQSLKLAEFIGFYFYLKANIDKVFNLQQFLSVIIVSGFFQAAIGTIQYLKQGSLGLSLLGESPISMNAPGTAVFMVNTERFLRAYGTTPHPNILAAWLFLAIFVFYWFYLYQKDREGRSSGISLVKKVGQLLVYAILLWGLFYTFSRTIIGFWGLGVIVWLLLLLRYSFYESLQAVKKRLATLVVVTFLTTMIFGAIYWPQIVSRINISFQDQAVAERIFYNKIAKSVTLSNPLLGIGVGQFVPNFISTFNYLPATAYQPVHNIYLLIASEVGLIGLAVFLLFLLLIFFNFSKQTKLKKPYRFSFMILAGLFLLVGLFDHFLWTSQQGGFIFWISLALLGANEG